MLFENIAGILALLHGASHLHMHSIRLPVFANNCVNDSTNFRKRAFDNWVVRVLWLSEFGEGTKL